MKTTKWIELLMAITVVVEIQNFKIMAVKNDVDSERELKEEVLTYFNEANYPDNENIDIIQYDLKNTLELEDCLVLKKIPNFI